MKVLIDSGLDAPSNGNGYVDYTQYVLDGTVTVEDSINVPTVTNFQLSASDSSFIVPLRSSYVKVVSDVYNDLGSAFFIADFNGSIQEINPLFTSLGQDPHVFNSSQVTSLWWDNFEGTVTNRVWHGLNTSSSFVDRQVGQYGNGGNVIGFHAFIVTQIKIPAAGTYQINFDHQDGFIFAIPRAIFISGVVLDVIQTSTPLAGYTFAGGVGPAGANVGGGSGTNSYEIYFPTAGFYDIEIDWASANALADVGHLHVTYGTSGQLFQTYSPKILATGFVTNQPDPTYLGLNQNLSNQEYQQLTLNVNVTSDEWLLNCQAPPYIPAFVNQTDSQILAGLAEAMMPGFFTPIMASGNLIPYYQYDPSQTWSDIAKTFADQNRYWYKVINKKIYYFPFGQGIYNDGLAPQIATSYDTEIPADVGLGIAYDETTQVEPQLFPLQMKTTVVSVPPVNDCIVIGDVEPQTNWDNYFVGDGFTSNFQLKHQVFQGVTSNLLEDDWTEAAFSTGTWIVNDPESTISLADSNGNALGALNIVQKGTSQTYTPIQDATFVQAQNGIELGGGINLQHGQISFNDEATGGGVIGGLFGETTDYSPGNCLAGFQIEGQPSLGSFTVSSVQATGAIMAVALTVNGTNTILAPGNVCACAGFSNATFLNGQSLFITSIVQNPTNFVLTCTPENPGIIPGNYGPTADNGTITFNADATIVTASGAAGIYMHPLYNGSVTGSPVVSQPNHQYVLQTWIGAEAPNRYTRPFTNLTQTATYGAQNLTASGTITWVVTDVNLGDYVVQEQFPLFGLFPAAPPPAVTKFYLTGLDLPPFAIYVLLSGLDLNVSVNYTVLSLPPQGYLTVQSLSGNSGGNLPWLPSQLTPAIPYQLGFGMINQTAQISQQGEAYALSFYTDDIPSVGARLRFQSWSAGQSAARVQDPGAIANEAVISGDSGIRSAIMLNLSPLPRTSDECEAAAAAAILDREYPQWQGSYTIETQPYSFETLFSPSMYDYPHTGMFFYINSPARGIDGQNVFVTTVRFQVVEMRGETLTISIDYGPDLYLEKLLPAFLETEQNLLVPTQTVPPPNPITLPQVLNAYLPTLDSAIVTNIVNSITGNYIVVNSGLDAGEACEVRYVDDGWGIADQGRIGLFTVPVFTLPRTVRDQTWYLRQLSGTFVPPTSGASGGNYGFFGMNIVGDNDTTNPITVPFSTYRFWDNTCRWQLTNYASGSYSFTNFDFWLNKIRAVGVYDVIYELGGTPNWASSQPSNTGCDNEAGGEGYCAPPTDLNSDGTGVNLIWRKWCKAVAQYFSAQTDILVSGWCPWNEFTRNSGSGNYAWVGTNAQMLRLSEDARAIILGRGTITATGESAAAAQATVGLSGPAYTQSANSSMQSPSTGVGDSGTHLPVFTAYMTQAGAVAAAEVLAFHIYGESSSDALTQYNLFTGILTGANVGKPLWLTELGWHTPPVPDPATVLSTWYNDLYNNGVKRVYWYAYIDKDDGLANGSGVLTNAGKAYVSVYNAITASGSQGGGGGGTFITGSTFSRFSKALRVVYPLIPSAPALVSANNTTIVFDYAGDVRDIYGIEVRAPSVSGATFVTIDYAVPADTISEFTRVSLPGNPSEQGNGFAYYGTIGKNGGPWAKYTAYKPGTIVNGKSGSATYLFQLQPQLLPTISQQTQAPIPNTSVGDFVRLYYWDTSWVGNPGAFVQTQAQPYGAPANTANATATVNSLLFNVGGDPNVPMLNFALNQAGEIGRLGLPWGGAQQHYSMVGLFTLYVPTAGDYTMSVNHDDGFFFGIDNNASYVSGPQVVAHPTSPLNNYPVLGGYNENFTPRAQLNDTWVINFPHAGYYDLEICYYNWENAQTLTIQFGVPTSPLYTPIPVPVGSLPQSMSIEPAWPATLNATITETDNGAIYSGPYGTYTPMGGALEWENIGVAGSTTPPPYQYQPGDIVYLTCPSSSDFQEVVLVTAAGMNPDYYFAWFDYGQTKHTVGNPGQQGDFGVSFLVVRSTSFFDVISGSISPIGVATITTATPHGLQPGEFAIFSCGYLTWPASTSGNNGPFDVNATNIDDVAPGGWPPTGWKPPCYLPSCNPGGSGNPTANAQHFDTTHNLDGSAMLMEETGPAFTNILWTYIAAHTDAPTYLNSDFWIYLSSNCGDPTVCGQIEIDQFIFSKTDNTEYMFGMQYDQVIGKWDVWAQGGPSKGWIHTSVTAGLAAGGWTHVQQYVHRVPGENNLYFDSISINGTNYPINMVEPAGPGFTTGECGIQFQLNTGSAGSGGVPITMWIDEANWYANQGGGGGGGGYGTMPTDGAVFCGIQFITAVPADNQLQFSLRSNPYPQGLPNVGLTGLGAFFPENPAASGGLLLQRPVFAPSDLIVDLTNPDIAEALQLIQATIPGGRISGLEALFFNLTWDYSLPTIVPSFAVPSLTGIIIDPTTEQVLWGVGEGIPDGYRIEVMDYVTSELRNKYTIDHISNPQLLTQLQMSTFDFNSPSGILIKVTPFDSLGDGIPTTIAWQGAGGGGGGGNQTIIVSPPLTETEPFPDLILLGITDFVGDTGTGGLRGTVPAPPPGSASGQMFLSASGDFAPVPSGIQEIIGVPPIVSTLIGEVDTVSSNVFTGDTGTGGLQGDVPAPPAGSAAAQMFLSASGMFATVPGASGALQPYVIGCTLMGYLPSSGAIVIHPLSGPIAGGTTSYQFASNLVGSEGFLMNPPVSGVVLSIYKNGVLFGTMTFTAGSHFASIVASAVSMLGGGSNPDVLIVITPAMVDGSAQNLGLTIRGTRAYNA